METKRQNKIKKLENRHSDPTYEAWKPLVGESFAYQEDYSDPTYEAWKQGGIPEKLKDMATFRSYL